MAKVTARFEQCNSDGRTKRGRRRRRTDDDDGRAWAHRAADQGTRRAGRARTRHGDGAAPATARNEKGAAEDRAAVNGTSKRHGAALMLMDASAEGTGGRPGARRTA
jgi:hypothetical protein